MKVYYTDVLVYDQYILLLLYRFFGWEISCLCTWSPLYGLCMLPVSTEWYYAYLTISPHIEYMMLMYTSSAVITLFIVYLLFALVCWAVLILSFCNLKKSNKKNTYTPDHRLLSPFLSTNDSTLYTLAHPVDRLRLSCNRLLLLLLTYDKLFGSVIFHSSCSFTFFVSIHLHIKIYIDFPL